MIRLPEWPERLAAAIRAARDKPFAWGRFDCALFACDCAAAMTGVDAGARFRDRYRTELGAARALKRIGGVASLEALAIAVLGPPISVAEAQRGDVVLIETEWGPALAVIALNGREAFAPSRTHGIVALPVASAHSAWRVG